MLNREALEYLIATKEIPDGEGGASHLVDLCDFSGENKARVFVRGLADAILAEIAAQGMAVVPREALPAIRTSMAMLQQNSEGCALNHYGDDAHQHGLPGWLVDTRKHLDELTAMLAAAGGEG